MFLGGFEMQRIQIFVTPAEYLELFSLWSRRDATAYTPVGNYKTSN